MEGCCQKKLGTSKQLILPHITSGVEEFPNKHKEAAKSCIIVGYGYCGDKSELDPIQYRYPGKLGKCDPF